MTNCANCHHGVVDHDGEGCRYGRASNSPCGCLCEYYPADASFVEPTPCKDQAWMQYDGAIGICDRAYGHVGDHRDSGAGFCWTDGFEGRLILKPVANPERTKVTDTQVGGDHYRQTGVQPWDVIDAWGLDFYAGNALKYLYRAGRKGPKVEDLKKARHYIDKMIELEEGKG